MSRPTRFIAAIVFAIALLVPATALAAPLKWQSIDVTVHNEQQSSKLLISGTLPADAKLPAQVELAAPAGSQIEWAGEILGGPVSEDPSVQYTVATKGGMDIYSFTLTKARTGQIELTSAGIVSQQGSDFTSALKYTPSQDVPALNLNVRIPRSSRVLAEAPGATLAPGGEANFSYYTKQASNVKAGTEVDLTFSYSAGAAAAPATNTPGGGSNTILVTLVVLLAAAGFGIGLASISRKMKSAEVEEEWEDEEADAPAPRKRPADATSAVSVDETPEEAPRRGLSGPQKVGLAGLLAAIVIVVALLAQNNSSEWVDGKLTKNYGGTDACTTASMPITTPGGRTIEDVGPEMLKALTPVTGIKTATIDSATSRIEIAFCDSTTSEEALRQALSTTGVQLGQSTAGVPAEVPAAAPATATAP